MKVERLVDRLRVTGTYREDGTELGAIPGGRWSKKLLCWEYPASPFTAYRLREFSRRSSFRWDCDNGTRDLLEEFAVIRGASAWKKEKGLTAIEEAALAGNLFHTGTKPWRHQAAANAFATDLPACYLALDMGTGKTLVAINQILEHGAMKTLVLAPKSVLDVWVDEIHRHAAEAGMLVHILSKPSSAEKADELQWVWARADAEHRPLVVIINYESAWRAQLGEVILRKRWDMVIADECVIGSTRIATPWGAAAIQDIHEGDLVLGWDGERVVETRVISTMCRDTMEPLIEVAGVTMTGNHPVWTRRGYINGSETHPSDYVRVLRRSVFSGSTVEEILLEELQHEGSLGIKAGVEGADASQNAGTQTSPRGTGEATAAPQRADQPVQRSIRAGEINRESERTWVRSPEWWQREVDRSEAARTLRHAGGWVADGVLRPDRGEATSPQGGYRMPGEEGSNRGGWTIAPISSSSGSRQAERYSPFNGWLDGNQSQERARNQSCRVFNLETGTGNYFANGLLVHNCHKLKTPSGKASKWAYKLGKQAERKLALSGTPLPNNQLDIFGQMRFLDPGIFGTNFTRFRARYARMGGYGGYQITGWIHEEEYRKLLDLVTFRVDKSVLELPETMDVKRLATFDPEKPGGKVYRDLEESFVADVRSGTVTASNALTRLLRLQQVTSGFVGTEEGVEEPLGAEKEELLEEVLSGIASTEQVIVFCRFRHDLEVVRRICERLGRTYGELSGNQKDLEGGRLPTHIQVLGTQIQAGGLGVNLIAARYCIFYSLGFSLAEYEQARARVHRGGQTRNVMYIHLIMKGTVDEKVYEALAAKKDAVEEIMTYIKRGEA